MYHDHQPLSKADLLGRLESLLDCREMEQMRSGLRQLIDSLQHPDGACETQGREYGAAALEPPAGHCGSRIDAPLGAESRPGGDEAGACTDSAGQKREAAALRGRMAFKLAILDSVAIEIAVLDRDGVIVEVNEAWRRFAFENGSEPGKPVPHTDVGFNYLAACRDNGGCAEQDALDARDGIRAVLDGRLASFRLEYPCHTPEQQRWFNMHVTPLGPDARYVVVAHSNITERKRAEEELRLSRARLAWVLEKTGVGLWFNELASNRLNWDQQTRCLFFIPPDVEPTHGLFWSRLHAEDREPTRLAIEAAIRNRTLYEIDHRAVNPDSSEIRWIRSAGQATYAADGTPTRLDGINYDISERKQIEAKLAEHAQQLREADRRKDEFLAMLAHELRNPLAPIRNAVQILKGPATDAAQLAWCRDIVDRQVEHLVRLVDDLLDIARINRGRVELKKEPLAVEDFIRPAVESSRPLIDARRQKFSVALPPQPLWVEGDRVRLAQVVANLLNNAAKYTGEGGHIGLEAEACADQVCIRVRDTGCGIEPSALPSLFDMFYQVDRNLDRSQGGLGIGLSLVHSLVAMHGGAVWAFSAGHDRGSEFVVRLPRLSLPETANGPVAAVPPPLRVKLRILVVDDNRDAAESLAMLLEIDGHQVWIADDGPAALAMAQAERPEVVLLDIGLPGMNGYAVAQALRQCAMLGRVRLIALTGYGQPDDREKSRAAGFDEHLVKPVDLEVLRKLLAGCEAAQRHESP